MDTGILIRRLQRLIIEDKKRINGFNLCVHNAKTLPKERGYMSTVIRLKESIKRKEEAIEFLENAHIDDVYTWQDIYTKFHFKGHKQ